jgi:glutamate-1-semialdehyde aminotransferase
MKLPETHGAIVELRILSRSRHVRVTHLGAISRGSGGPEDEQGVQDAIDERSLPWHVTRLGCRVEYLFRRERPVNGTEAAAGGDALLDRLIHLYALNRGVLLTPFHNMALMSPATTASDVDVHTAVFGEAVRELGGA